MSSPGNRRHWGKQRDTNTQGDTNAQYNRQTTALRSHWPLAGGCRRGMQLQCNAVWELLVSNSRSAERECESAKTALPSNCPNHRPKAPGAGESGLRGNWLQFHGRIEVLSLFPLEKSRNSAESPNLLPHFRYHPMLRRGRRQFKTPNLPYTGV